MTEEFKFDPTQTINTAGILFRMAVQSAKRSKQKGVLAQGEFEESRFREVDEYIVTVMMVHAAIEAAWHWEFILHGVSSLHWPTKFYDGEGIRFLCERNSREVVSVPEEVLSAVKELGAWRNFLQHGDARARANLEEFIGTSDFRPFMNYEKARYFLEVGDRFFTFLAGSTGSQNLGQSKFLWAGWD